MYKIFSTECNNNHNESWAFSVKTPYMTLDWIGLDTFNKDVNYFPTFSRRI